MNTRLVSFAQRREYTFNKKEWNFAIFELKRLINITLNTYYQSQLDIVLDKELIIKNEVFSYLDIITTKAVLSKDQQQFFLQTINFLVNDNNADEIETIEQIADVLIYIWLVKNTKTEILECSKDALYCIVIALSKLETSSFKMIKYYLDVYFNNEVYQALEQQIKKDNTNIIDNLSNLYSLGFKEYNVKNNKKIFLEQLKSINKKNGLNKNRFTTIGDIYQTLKEQIGEIELVLGCEAPIILSIKQQIEGLSKFHYLTLEQQQQFIKEINMVDNSEDIYLNKLLKIDILIRCYSIKFDINSTVIVPEFGRKRGKIKYENR